ncbi:MAG: hypothetical protein TEF_09840 [Rhizobiales bacterium NRL2]|jgi:hypothetical protein|nr:MAG: hypothetical protein TEF_09840 [Rhizobiales bacterium NRL2]
MIRAVFFVLILAASAGVTQAREVSIGAFEGVWRGSAVSESDISTHFRVTARDMDVEIRGESGGGFSVRWATILRQKGVPDAPVEVLKEARVSFVPDPDRTKVWRSARGGDPMSGEGYYWARLEEQTLTVYGLGVAADGTAELQVYRRTLTDLGMELEFIRTVDGEPVRTARGKLIKFAK